MVFIASVTSLKLSLSSIPSTVRQLPDEEREREREREKEKWKWK
jgi:hypothetical protein